MKNRKRQLACNAAILLTLLALVLCAAYDPRSRSVNDLVKRFREAHVFWEQYDVAKQIVASRDRGVLTQLRGYLAVQDRHERANAAFIFAGLGDARGLDVLLEILVDQSNRLKGQAYPGFGCLVQRVGDACPYYPNLQIEADRYYAANLLGELGDPRAVPALIAVLDVPSVNLAAIWSLAEIDDKRAVGPLITLLGKDDPTVQVLAIRALAKMDAKEAIPALYRSLDDTQRSHVDDLVSVKAAAQEALASLRAK